MKEIVSKEVYSSPFNFKPQFTPQEGEEVQSKEPEAPPPTSSFGNGPIEQYSEPEYDDQGNYVEEEPNDAVRYEDDEPQELPDNDSPEPEEDDDDTPLDEEQVATSLYEAFKSLGFINDEAEIPKANSVTDFLINYEKAKAAKLEEAARKNLEETYSPERLQYVDFLMKGGSPEAISSVYQLLNLPIEDERADSSNRKALILAMYKDKGLADKRANDLYNKTYDDDEDLEEAKTAKQYFKGKHDEQLAQIQAQDEAELQLEAQKNEQLQQSLKTMLKERKVSGVDFSEKEAKELESYMFTPNVIVDVMDPGTGVKYKSKVSQYYDDYQKFFSNPESLIKLAKFIKAGGQPQTEEEEIRERVSNEILKGLNGFKNPNVVKNGGSKKKNAFLTK